METGSIFTPVKKIGVKVAEDYRRGGHHDSGGLIANAGLSAPPNNPSIPLQFTLYVPAVAPP